MAERIDRKEIFFEGKQTGNKEYDEGFLDGAMCVLNAIDEMPTIEAKPVVHAHWENKIVGFFSCSHCDHSVHNNCNNRKEQEDLFNDKFGMTAFAYCSYCGAQMDEKEKSLEEFKRELSRGNTLVIY